MSDNTRPSLDSAVAAARAGNRDEATRQLRQLVADDPFNADAWVWLGGVTSDVREQRAALEHALTIAPQNARATQGLQWLRQNRPDVFNEPVQPIGATRAPGDRHTPSYERDDRAERATASQPVFGGAAAGAQVYDTPTQPLYNSAPAATSTVYDAPTQAMAAPQADPYTTSNNYTYTPQQTDRMATQPYVQPYSAPGNTDRMAVAPPPPAVAEPARPVYQRAAGANFARWLVILCYLFGFGAVVTVAAVTIADPQRFVATTNQQLAPMGSQLDPNQLTSIWLSTAATLAGIAILDAILILGLLFRGRWAWVINLLLATAIFVGGIALLVTPFLLPNLIGPLGINNPLLLTVGGLALFTFVFWLLSLGSRRAFFRRRVEPAYGGQ